MRAITAMVLLTFTAVSIVVAQEADESSSPSPAAQEPNAATIGVEPVAHDEQIRVRLQGILDATGWFTRPSVRVEDGVVFLEGETEEGERRKWAGDLARRTQDVAAVVNGIEVTEPAAWDFRAARSGLAGLWRDLVRSLPFVVFGVFVLLLASLAAWLVVRTIRRLLQRRIRANLLRTVLARAAGTFVLLAGFYVVLRIAGLTQLALTVLGGTGLLGLAVGIAFRDITENFLASIFLSMQRPFETGDLVEVEGVTGYVQQLNVRTTVLMNLDGNVVQVPNATVYKATLRNYTSNPKRREIVSVGIGYDVQIDEAQRIVREVLAAHPAVLDDPEPWVLADSFGSATIGLRIYFWLDGVEHSWLKVRSSVIRLVKRAFLDHGISMPDEAREVILPQGLDVRVRAEEPSSAPSPSAAPERPEEPPGTVCTEAEAGLHSEASDLERQASEAAPVESENLLTGEAAPPSPRRGIAPWRKA